MKSFKKRRSDKKKNSFWMKEWYNVLGKPKDMEDPFLGIYQKKKKACIGGKVGNKTSQFENFHGSVEETSGHLLRKNLMILTMLKRPTLTILHIQGWTFYNEKL